MCIESLKELYRTEFSKTYAEEFNQHGQDILIDPDKWIHSLNELGVEGNSPNEIIRFLLDCCLNHKELREIMGVSESLTYKWQKKVKVPPFKLYRLNNELQKRASKIKKQSKHYKEKEKEKEKK